MLYKKWRKLEMMLTQWRSYGIRNFAVDYMGCYKYQQKAYSYWLNGFADTIYTLTSPKQKEIVFIFIGRLEVH